MSLLRRIQDATVNPKFQLADVLRMCKILAARLDHSAFREWINQELNGYVDNRENLPNYRIFTSLGCRGDFFGSFGSGLKNAPIPLISLPGEFREAVSTKHVFQSVSSLENTVKQANQSNTSIVRALWDADAVALLGSDIYENMICGQAWTDIPTASFVAVLDTVKSRILDFVIEIEAENPSAGDAEPGEKPIPDAVTSNIFNNCILHQHHQTASSGAVIQTHHQGTTHMSENYTNNLQRANVANFANKVQDNAQQVASDFSQGINQNLEEILSLIDSLREMTQQFPESQREEALVHLDDLQEDITTPGKQKPQRIRTRIVALLSTVGIVAGTTAGIVAGTTDFANNVLELSEKLGVPIDINISQIVQENTVAKPIEPFLSSD